MPFAATRNTAIQRLLIAGVIASLIVVPTGAFADEASAKEKLKQHGLRVTTTGIVHADEAEFSKAMGEISKLKKKLILAHKNLASAEKEQQRRDQDVRKLREENVVLSKQLANVGTDNITTHNRLVGALNANIGQMQLIDDARKSFDKEMDEVRRAANTAREGYVEQLLALRPLSQKVAERYKELAENKDVKAAVEEYNASAKKSFAVEPSRTFQTSVKRIDTLEKSVISEKVPLRREGNSYFATVVINSKHTQEMIVDTGASLLTLPYRMAKESGIEFSENDRPITLTIADGTRISGRLTTLPLVRVGQFSATDVECAVLGPEATNAPALLGMSFLGKFKFELNAQSSQLSLVRVDSEEAGPSDTKKPTAGSAAVKKRPAAPTKKQPVEPPPKPMP